MRDQKSSSREAELQAPPRIGSGVLLAALRENAERRINDLYRVRDTTRDKSDSDRLMTRVICLDDLISVINAAEKQCAANESSSPTADSRREPR